MIFKQSGMDLHHIFQLGRCCGIKHQHRLGCVAGSCVILPTPANGCVAAAVSIDTVARGHPHTKSVREFVHQCAVGDIGRAKLRKACCGQSQKSRFCGGGIGVSPCRVCQLGCVLKCCFIVAGQGAIAKSNRQCVRQCMFGWATIGPRNRHQHTFLHQLRNRVGSHGHVCLHRPPANPAQPFAQCGTFIRQTDGEG